MSTISIRLPDSLHKQIRRLAEQDGISMNQFIATAAAEKLAALMTVDYIEERAKRGSREKFKNALAQLPHVEPDHHDKL